MVEMTHSTHTNLVADILLYFQFKKKQSLDVSISMPRPSSGEKTIKLLKGHIAFELDALGYESICCELSTVGKMFLR